MEKVYKAMRNTGAANIAIGIIVIAVGVSAGIVSIITGANLLKKKRMAKAAAGILFLLPLYV